MRFNIMSEQSRSAPGKAVAFEIQGWVRRFRGTKILR